MLNIFKPKEQRRLEKLLVDRVHYACGKEVFDGWLNVDGFDVSYPDGQIDPELVPMIYHTNLVEKHPFPEDYFRFGYSQDFLEHLTQAESLLFLEECFRTFAPGGVLRLSFPGLAGVMERHFNRQNFDGTLQGINDAYTMWHHEHFYCIESIDLVARHIGFSKIKQCEYGESQYPELAGRDSRLDQKDLNLMVELTK